MSNTDLSEIQNNLLKEFTTDSNIIGIQTNEFLSLVYPSYLVDRDNIESLLESINLEKKKLRRY